MDATQQRYYAIYQSAAKRLRKHPQDTEAEFTVNLWEASKNLYRQVAELKQTVEDAAKTAASNYYKIDQLESKVEMLRHNEKHDSSANTFESYLASLSADVLIEKAKDKDSGTFTRP